MQEYWIALVPLAIGLVAFAVGLVFALGERHSQEWRKLRDLKHEQMQQELDLGRAGNARTRRTG